MDDLLDALPRSDRNLIEAMAEDAQTRASAMAKQILREYLGLVRSAPNAIPKSPLRRLTAGAIRRKG